ncbi:hypothetical protein [Niameybacter massiliensis]|uniref:hypothetical protein n=1 Tax=Niameybacter massiliensis TaxID=1658108 RepID=UPI0012B57FA5|nr:hypothetical protein [Niameybacter massiliensis]
MSMIQNQDCPKKGRFIELINSTYYQMDMLDYLMCKGNEKVCNSLETLCHSCYNCCNTENDLKNALNNLNMAINLYYFHLNAKLDLLCNHPILLDCVCTPLGSRHNTSSTKCCHCKVCGRSRQHKHHTSCHCPCCQQCLQNTCCEQPTHRHKNTHTNSAFYTTNK